MGLASSDWIDYFFLPPDICSFLPVINFLFDTAQSLFKAIQTLDYFIHSLAYEEEGFVDTRDGDS